MSLSLVLFMTEINNLLFLANISPYLYLAVGYFCQLPLLQSI